MQQRQLDQITSTKGKNQYQNKLSSLKSYSLESRSSYGLRLSAILGARVSTGIEKSVKGYFCDSVKFKPAWLQWLDNLPFEVIAWITLQAVIDNISETIPLSFVLGKLGANLETEHLARLLKAEHSEAYQEARNKALKAGKWGIRSHIRNAIFERSKSVGLPAWNIDHRDHFSEWCLNVLRHHTGMVTIHGEGSRKEVSPTPELKDWIAAHIEKEQYFRPVFMPRVDPPKDWTGMRDGGFTSSHWQPAIVRHRNDCGDIGFDDVGETATGAVNKLQSVKWRINQPMMEMLEWAFKSDMEIGKLPRSTLHDMSKVSNDQFYAMTKPQRDEHVRSRKRLHQANDRIASKRYAALSSIGQCRLVKDQTIYFPMTMDYRGRMYMRPTSPQGVDYMRCLFEFQEGKKLDNMGIEWLAVHGANLWGERGCKWTRVDWIRRHEEQIVRCAENPYDMKWWHEAKKPWCFLAFCNDWKGVVEKGTDHISHLPVQMDGSCNGAQILSLLLGDTTLASQCNVLPSKDQEPQDIYAAALEDTLDLLCEHEDVLLRDSWFKVGLDRDAIKGVVMNIPNGQSEYAAVESLVEYYDKYVDAGGNDFFGVGRRKACTQLAALIYQACDKIMGNVNLLRGRLELLVEVLHGESSDPIKWKSPSGFTVSQKFIDETGHYIETLYNGERHRLASYYDCNDINVEKAKRAIMPNLIHSHDAAIAHKVVMQAGLDSIATIHDCYMTHASDARHLNETILQVVHDTYVGKDWLQDLGNQVGFPLPDIEGRGDLSGVLDSEYMFS
tara:strand:- start:22596 stop:24941 length:2346 start_codon:yes stop_codon:yes gene_type:complete